MTNPDCAFAANLVADIWGNLQDRLTPFNLAPEVEMHLLGVFQHSVEAFGLSREEASLPLEDAAIIYAKRVTGRDT